MSRPRSLPVGLKPYRVSSAFGIVRHINGRNTPPHNGADWATPVGIPLEATIGGKVSLVGGSLTHVWGYYVHIICTCPLKHVVEYHILRDKPTFKIGDPIKPGQHIGFTGSSGALNGARYAPHHHHGTSENGTYFNPLTIGWPSEAGTKTGDIMATLDDEDLGNIANAVWQRAQDALGKNAPVVILNDIFAGNPVVRKAADVATAIWEQPQRATLHGNAAGVVLQALLVQSENPNVQNALREEIKSALRNIDVDVDEAAIAEEVLNRLAARVAS